MVVETELRPKEPPYSESLTQILQTAEEAAKDRNHPYIGSEHILLALTVDEEVVAILNKLKVKPEKVRSATESYLDGVSSMTKDKIDLTFRVQNIMADITQNAAQDGRVEVSPVDLFRGIVGDNKTAAAQILKPLKVTAGRLKKV